MAADVPRISQLLQASLDPQQNKQGEFPLFTPRQSISLRYISAQHRDISMY
jgi:hypothetical protein